MRPPYRHAFATVCLLLCACDGPRRTNGASGTQPSNARTAGVVTSHVNASSSSTMTVRTTSPAVASATNIPTTTDLDPARERMALLDSLISSNATSTLHPELAQLLAFRPNIESWQSDDWARIVACINEFSPADQKILIDMTRAALSNLRAEDYPMLERMAQELCRLSDSAHDRVFSEQLVERASRTLWFINQNQKAEELISASIKRMQKDANANTYVYAEALSLHGYILLTELKRYAEAAARLQEYLNIEGLPQGERNLTEVDLHAAYARQNDNPELRRKGILHLQKLAASNDEKLALYSHSARWWLGIINKEIEKEGTKEH